MSKKSISILLVVISLMFAQIACVDKVTEGVSEVQAAGQTIVDETGKAIQDAASAQTDADCSDPMAKTWTDAFCTQR